MSIKRFDSIVSATALDKQYICLSMYSRNKEARTKDRISIAVLIHLQLTVVFFVFPIPAFHKTYKALFGVDHSLQA